jgi:nicotinamidase/pyrazinamidase
MAPARNAPKLRTLNPRSRRLASMALMLQRDERVARGVSEPASPGVGVHAGDALLVVDLQRDFLPGGSLAVPGGDAVLEPVNQALARFHRLHRPVFASRDWHPADHSSFKSSGGRWPPHCVAESPGAEFDNRLRLPPGAGIVSKGCVSGDDGYSAFAGTDLQHRLQASGVRRLFVAGLATDYCVRSSVMDALALGYAVVVLRDAVAAVDLQPGDGERALADMRSGGALLTETTSLRG